jgi:hypothetical protein
MEIVRHPAHLTTANEMESSAAHKHNATKTVVRKAFDAGLHIWQQVQMELMAAETG